MFVTLVKVLFNGVQATVVTAALFHIYKKIIIFTPILKHCFISIYLFVRINIR